VRTLIENLPILSSHQRARMNLEIEYARPCEIKPDPGNARVHPKAQVKQIADSIRLNGFVNPLLVDEDNVLIAGHGRLLAAKSLDLPSVPYIRLLGLSETQKRVLRIADNRIAQGAGWDFDLLKVELDTIASLDVSFDLTLTGFTSPEIDRILSEGDTPDPADNEVPALQEVSVSQVGDIWILGDHRVGCGDCSDAAFVDAVMNGREADAAFVDPPYNIKISGNAVSKGRHKEFVMASGELGDDEFARLLKTWCASIARVSRDGAVHFVCMDHRHMEELLAAGREVYGARLNICVWNKSNAGMGSLYRSKHEMVAVFRVGATPNYNAVELGKNGRNRTNVWDYASVNSRRGSRRHDLDLHPTVKPAAMVADAIRDVTRRGDLVIDTFLGSGTTLIACERTGRRFCGMDLDPTYVDVAVRRWIAMTGSRAVNAATGEDFDARAKTLATDLGKVA